MTSGSSSRPGFEKERERQRVELGMKPSGHLVPNVRSGRSKPD